jgi:hypothetical protein
VANTAPEFSSSVVITQYHKNQAKEILRGLGGTVRLVMNSVFHLLDIWWVAMTGDGG